MSNDNIYKFLDNKMRKKIDRKMELKVAIVKGEIESTLKIGKYKKGPRPKPNS